MADEFDQYKATPDEFAQFKDSSASTQMGIAPVAPPASIGGRISKWAQNVQEDLKNGTDLTGIGTLMKKMGAHGLYNGNSEKLGELLGSLPMGLAKVAEGAGQLAGGDQPGQMLSGAGRMVEGAGQASTFIAPFGGGEAASAIEKGIGAIPKMANAPRAGKIIGQIESQIGHIPIEINEPGWKALDIKKLSDTGDSTPPKVIRDFIRRILDTNQPPLTFKEARDFYSNATRKLTPEEMQKLSPKMRRELGGFADTLDKAIGDTADDHGLGQQYEDAMQEYRTAMRRQARVQRLKDSVVDVTKSTAFKTALGAGAGAALGDAAYNYFKK